MRKSIKLIPSFAILAALTTATWVAAAAPDAHWTADLRARWESTDSPSGNAARDQDYDFSNLRARFGLDAKWTRWSIHAVVQGAASYDLPDNGAFGIGPAYFSANGKTDPSDVGLLELDATYHGDHLQLTLGRQKWGDGAETLTGVAYLDGVKKRRLGERLIGNWDWVNVGRRYDGASFGLTSQRFHLAGFAFEPLQGGVNYRDAFENFDSLAVYGLTLTGRYGQTLGKGEWRLFAIEYNDDRPGARAAAHAAIDLQTIGASLLVGGERSDFLAWVAVQEGDWGTTNQQAWAFIVEAGRKLGGTTVQTSGRIGLAQASGDGSPGGDHKSFFNLLPTNHKFYGAIDYSAFSNLRNVYLDFSLSRGALELGIGLHHFQLVDRADAWYGGSGAFNDAALGYAARRPASGRFTSSDLGNELDVSLTWKLQHAVQLGAGVSYFDGGAAAREVLAVDDNGTWVYLQASWKH